ncbi:MAG: hypothetical protein JNJ54_23220 [Myxococcaceae bacterium]|nr:hypothetical protein [Myxococcaceae bacterium]
MQNAALHGIARASQVMGLPPDGPWGDRERSLFHGGPDAQRHTAPPFERNGTEGSRIAHLMTPPDELVREAERRLAIATGQLEALEAELDKLEVEVERLERGLAERTAPGSLSAWASVRAGLAPPLAALSAGLFFDTGIWPLGLLASLAFLAQVLVFPSLNRSAR